jgi:hypothetical protein
MSGIPHPRGEPHVLPNPHHTYVAISHATNTGEKHRCSLETMSGSFPEIRRTATQNVFSQFPFLVYTLCITEASP